MAHVDELRARRDRLEERVEVIPVVAKGNANRARADLDRVEDVARERRPATDDLVAVVEGRLAQAVDDAVGPRADRDLLEADAVVCGERGAQLPRAAVGIAVQLTRAALEGFDRCREGRERALVRRELDDALEAEFALDFLDRLPGLVRDEVGDRAPEEPAAVAQTTGGVPSFFWRQNRPAAPVPAAKPRPTTAVRLSQPDLPWS